MDEESKPKCHKGLELLQNLGLNLTVEKLDIAFYDPFGLSSDLCRIQNRYAFQGAYNFKSSSSKVAPGQKKELIVPTLFIDGQDMGTLDNLKVEEIKALAEPSPFGMGTKTVYDENVRKATEVRGNRITLDLDLTGEVQTMAPMGYKVVPKLYKLAIYEKDGFFAEHADTLHGENHIGTLVVCLPVQHEGGAFILSDDGNKLVLPFDELIKTGKNNQIPWVAFYTDVKHKVEVVKSGVRMTIQYDLVVEKKSAEEEKNLTARLEGDNVKEPNNRYRFQDYNKEIMATITNKLKKILLFEDEEEKSDEKLNEKDGEKDEEEKEVEVEDEDEDENENENENEDDEDDYEERSRRKGKGDRFYEQFSQPDGIAIMLKRRYGASSLSLDKLKGTDSALYYALKDQFNVEVKKIILEHRTDEEGTYNDKPIEVVAIAESSEKQESCSSEEEGETDLTKKHVPEKCQQPKRQDRYHRRKMNIKKKGDKKFDKIVCLVSGLSPQALSELVNQTYIECTGNDAMEGVNSYIHAALFVYPKVK